MHSKAPFENKEDFEFKTKELNEHYVQNDSSIQFFEGRNKLQYKKKYGHKSHFSPYKRYRPSSIQQRHTKYDYCSNSITCYNYSSRKSPRKQRKRRIVSDKEDQTEVYVGDVLAKRYEVIRKLGEGGFSLVVECYDIQKGVNVAVKLQRPKYKNDAKYEIDTLELIQSQKRRYPEESCFVIELLDWFEYDNSINMVFPLCSQSLLDILNKRSNTPAFTLPEIRTYSKQLLQTLACIIIS